MRGHFRAVAYLRFGDGFADGVALRNLEERWIRLGAAAYTLYSVADSAHLDITQPPPPQGLGLDATDLEELSGLVNNRTPVTITD